MTFDRPAFTDFEALRPFSVGMGDKSIVTATGKGTVWITLLVQKKQLRCKLQNVLFVPELSYQLFSVGCVDTKGMVTAFKNKTCTISQNDKIVAEGKLRSGLYYLCTVTNDYASKNEEQAMLADLGLWHQRLAHVHSDGIIEMVKRNIVTGIKIGSSKTVSSCSGCLYGKNTRAPTPKQGGKEQGSAESCAH